MPPIWVSEASVARESSACGEGCWSGTTAARRHFAFWKASCASSVHSNVLDPPFRISVKGRNLERNGSKNLPCRENFATAWWHEGGGAWLDCGGVIGKHTFKTVQSVVHHVFKSLCTVRQSKRRKKVLQKTKWHDDCCFWNVCGCTPDLVVTLDKVNFENMVQPCSPWETSCMFGSGYLSGGCDQVQTTIIATRPLWSIFFGHHVQRRGPWRFWMTNNASGFQRF